MIEHLTGCVSEKLRCATSGKEFYSQGCLRDKLTLSKSDPKVGVESISNHIADGFVGSC